VLRARERSGVLRRVVELRADHWTSERVFVGEICVPCKEICIKCVYFQVIALFLLTRVFLIVQHASASNSSHSQGVL
jgi:hypothetical protein